MYLPHMALNLLFQEKTTHFSTVSRPKPPDETWKSQFNALDRQKANVLDNSLNLETCKDVPFWILRLQTSQLLTFAWSFQCKPRIQMTSELGRFSILQHSDKL